MEALSGFFGGGARGEMRRQQRQAIRQSYEYGEQTYSYLGQGREQAEQRYQSRLGEMRARMAGSGGRLGAAWENVQGELLRERNEALQGLAREEQEFRQSETYDLFRQDFEAMTQMRSARPLFQPSADYREYAFGGSGTTGERVFTEEQQSQLRTYRRERGDTSPQFRLYEQYAIRMRPTLQEWEKARFGGKEAMETFRKTMDERIAQTNEWYDRRRKELAAIPVRPRIGEHR